MITKKLDARPSIHSVAAYAGVSIATVSKVMQGVATVRKENVVAVQNAIEALGYRINPLGAELRRGQRKLIGAIVRDFEDAVSASLLAALERHVEARGFTMLIASSRHLEEREVELVGRMQDWRVAGLIIESDAGRQKAALLLRDGPPAVFIGNPNVQEDFDVVVHDTVPPGVRGKRAPRRNATDRVADSSEAARFVKVNADSVLDAIAATAVAQLFKRIEEPDSQRITHRVGTAPSATE